jgi:hypothetical protein
MPATFSGCLLATVYWLLGVNCGELREAARKRIEIVARALASPT